MNSEEGMSMAKMAVTVLLVVLVIGAVIAIVFAAYSWFNSGTDNLAQRVNGIQSSQMSQFDDTQVTGSDVLSALKNFRDSDVAVYITNTKIDSGKDFATLSSNGGKAANYCALIDGSADSNSSASGGANQVMAGEVTVANGKCTCKSFALESDGLTIKRNTNFSPTTATSNKECYVKQSAKWYAKLVYSEDTDDVAGVWFIQMK